MRKRMTKINMLMVVVIGLTMIQFGCGPAKMTTTGFLSDYSRLKTESDMSMGFVDDAALARYSSFIVDPVVVHFHHRAKSKGKLSLQQLADLTNYMHSKFIEAVEDAGKEVVHQPAKGVARIRAALTDVEKTDMINIVPTASLTGLGLGGASIEIEIIDSETGKQIGAALETKKGSRVPFSNLGDWATAKSVMNDWAKRLQKRLQQ
ncbi:MAG: DUF3313 domain-containing protein [Planctomycetes bacterium]|nr:DUF3313 domain-containing protein [Planctomycetota bacterium]